MSSYQTWLDEASRRRTELGLVRSLRPRAARPSTIDLAGNDYLGLATHPEVTAAAAAAAITWGGGAGASRLVTGTLELHADLEQALAGFTRFDSALVFSTGYHANLGVVSALADADTLIVSDSHVHASMIDACRLAKAEVAVVPHNDVEAVRAALSGRRQRRALVLVETVYSVLGDAAPVRELADACAEFDAPLVADEAHGLGVVGGRGQGLLADADLAGLPHVVATATLSKSLGAQGGLVLAPAAVRDHLVNTARPFIYDTGLAPAAAGAALAALAVIQREPERVARVRVVAQALADGCGIDRPAGAVLAVAMPGPTEAVAAVAEAAEAGLVIGCFRPPSTPDGISRLRLTAHADLDDVTLDRAVQILRSLTEPEVR